MGDKSRMTRLGEEFGFKVVVRCGMTGGEWRDQEREGSEQHGGLSSRRSGIVSHQQ